jgi:hypothetical protein
MRPHAAYPTGRAGTAESAPSILRHSPTDARAWTRSQGALAPLVALRGHLDAPSCPAHCPDADVRTNAARVPFTRPLLPPRRACTPIALPPCRAITSRSPSAQARVAPTQHAIIKRGPLLFGCPRPPPLSPSGKPPRSEPPLFSTTPSVPSQLTLPPSPCAGPRASPEPRAAPWPKGPAPSPSLSSGTVDRAGELCSSVAHLCHHELEIPTVSGGFAVCFGCSR